MITCPACGKQNQDHYRFCLGCGAELPRGGAKPDEGVADEPTNHGAVPTPEPEPEPVAAEPVAPPVAGGGEPAPLPPGKCPECGYVNPTTNRFCASCGFRLDEAQKVAPSPAVVEEGSHAVLIALDPEGNEVGRHSLPEGKSIVGRESGSFFETDGFLSPQHAAFDTTGGKVTVRDLDSLNGVFRKLIAEQRSELVSGQRFRIGQELLQYDDLPESETDAAGVSVQGSPVQQFVGRVSLVVGRSTVRPSYPISERGIDLGRERGDVLFPEDGYVSGLHCKISYEDGQCYVTDLGSSNGTFVQLRAETVLSNGDVLLMGQQLFRVAL
ncbi:MAG: FHA domain-containing protein [Polyangiaceae bacterium]